jgi:hypothetical protein
MANLIVQSDFQLLRALYIGELTQIVVGVPYGPLTWSRGLHTSHHEKLLFEAASLPAYRYWQEWAGVRIGGPGFDDRESMLKLADKAKVENKYRRATQIYGWLLLTSRAYGNEMKWARIQLDEIYSTHYFPNRYR